MGFKMRRFVDLPLKYKLILYFLSLIVLSVVLFGLLSYRLVVNQISENTNNLLSDTVYQTTFFLNEKLTTVLEKLVLLENDMVIRNITQQGNAAYTEEQRFRDRMHITTNMDELYAGNPQMIDSIYLKYNNMQEYHLQKDEILRSIEINLQEWLQTYNTSERGYYWLNNHEDTIFRTIKKRNVITVLKTFGTMDSQFNGISVINLRSDYFLDILNNIQVSTNGYIALISPDGIFLSKDVQDPFLIGEQELSLLRNSEKKGSFSVTNRENESLFVVFDSLQVNNWVIAAIVPEGDLFEKTTQIKYLSLIIITVLLIFSSLVATLLAESFSKSIRYLSNQVRKVESGNFNIEFKVQESNEIGILAKGLTSLVKSIKSLMTQIREEQDKKRKLELLLLQSQMNPHFLYNTLASIQQLIENQDASRASTMLRAITGFFRIGISKGQDIIYVAEEIMHIENYLIIQKMRYTKDFDYELDMADEIMQHSMMKLILQPIVENAIYHGIKNKYGRGRLKVSGRVRGTNLIFEIFDDGVGIHPDHLKNLIESINKHEIDQKPITFGLKNVNQRIKLYYGEPYGIQLESMLYEFTKVLVTIPIITEQPQQEEGSHGSDYNR